MRPQRWLFASATSLGIVALSSVFAQKEKDDGGRPKLDADVFAVRLLLGVGDTTPQDWSGSLRVDGGEVLGVNGYRFRQGDRTSGRESWEARSRLIRKVAAKKAAAKAQMPAEKGAGPTTFGATTTPNGVVASLRAHKDATLHVETKQGKFDLSLAELADGSIRRALDGRVQAQRVPPSIPLLEGPDQDDFPSAAVDKQGTAWVAYVTHKPRGPEVLESFRERPKSFAEFAPKGGGDQVRLLRFADGQPGAPLDVTEPGLDVWRPAVAVDGDGKVVVVWSENRDGNWDLHARRYDPSSDSWSKPERLTTNPGADVDVVLATVPDSGVWMAWQCWIDGEADIQLAPVSDAGSVVEITKTKSNEWSPAIVAGRDGKDIYVAYDTYEPGQYDVRLCRVSLASDRHAKTEYVVADSPRYEARPSLAIDPKNRVWIAYEERAENWGKDAENLQEGKGSTLYRDSAVRVRCLEPDSRKLFDAPDPIAGSLPMGRKWNSFPRLASDRDGRIWLAFRHRQEAIWGNNAVMVAGGVWVEHVTALAGKSWSVPEILDRSDGLLDNRPAIVVPEKGTPLVFYNTDGRLRREVELTPELARRYYSHVSTPPGVINNDLEVAALVASGSVEDMTLEAVDKRHDAAPKVHPDEPADVARMRDYRVRAGGKTYQFLRGDFHRHTEVSQDGGSDGALEDMWRYAIDAAGLDWMGNDDHDNGGGKEYTWWLVQKSTDMYQSPKLTTMFTYERSVVYPHGHRNVMFARRGIRTLPRLVGNDGVVDDDTKMLYDYLAEHDGICASHTSATGMGTDWRDVDPKYEPFVEIYQGHRNSYEHFGAPRVARAPNESIGGWKPLGMVWNALAMQYRLGFQASSDHISTHISYAIALAEDRSREAVLDAFRRRHCYAATDNIVLDVRSGDHIMGDEFKADGPVTLKIVAHGTRPIAAVDIIKDFVYVYTTEPKAEKVSFEWTDDEKRPAGLSWYYVRVRQDDGQLAWGSPIWVHHGATGKAE